MKKLIMIISLCLFYLAGVAQSGTVDVVTLKNGSVIRGKILEQNGQVIKIYTTNRSMVEVKPDEVETMGKESGSTAAQSQTPGVTYDEDSFTAGNMIIGGSGSVDFLKQKTKVDGIVSSEYKRFGLSVSPTFAYFIMDGLAVGANVPLSYYSNKGDKSYSIGIGPVVKYYTDYLAVFKLSSAYEFNHSPNGKGSTLTLRPGIGMAFFLNPKVCLEPGIFYEFVSDNWKTEFSDTNRKYSTIGVEVGFTIFL